MGRWEVRYGGLLGHHRSEDATATINDGHCCGSKHKERYHMMIVSLASTNFRPSMCASNGLAYGILSRRQWTPIGRPVETLGEISESTLVS